MQIFFTKFFNNQKGSIAVIAALSMITLMGLTAFVLDFGVYYNEASRLQNALDSAALAAAKDLPAVSITCADWDEAKSDAITYAGSNGFSITQNNIEPVYKDNIITEEITGIKVSKSIQVNYNFAKVLGISFATVSRSATAGLTPAGGITGAIPLSITASSLNNAIAAGAVTNLTIKCSSNANDVGIDCTGVSGWFGALRFDGSGASTYSNLLAYGYTGALHVGQVLDMENGNMSGPTMDGFTTRYNRCTHGCTASNHEPNCPRLIYIPVVEVLSSSQVKIAAFSTFFLTECGGSGKNSYIKATYINNIVLPDTEKGTSGQDFGLYVNKLLN